MRIDKFVLLEADASEPAPVLRVAVCDLFKCDVLEKGFVYRVRDFANPTHAGWIVEVQSMSSKLMIARPGGGRQDAFFMQYITLSQS